MTDQFQGLDRGLTNYGDREFARFLRRSFARSMGLSRATLSKPIVGIAMTPSGFNNCHRTMPELVEAVTRGVTEAGALARPFPTVSLGEVFLNPTSMMYRNLMAMDTEEMIGAQPMDAVVLIGGCDKTVPAQLMGAASANVPAIQLVTGPMMTGRHKGQRLGACTDCRGFWSKYRANSIDSDEIETVEGRLSVTAGTCAVMGTASTMACIAEALGMSLPGTAAIPAVHADRLVAAEEAGKAAARLIQTKITPAQVITEKSVENAIRVLQALGGSTNAIVHLTAIAGRLGIKVSLDRFNQLSDETPVLVDLKPVGEGYMEDFHAAGGMSALLWELRKLLHLDTMDVEGRTLAERLDSAPEWVDPKVIRPFDDPVSRVGGLVALKGSLAPDGAIFKRAAATPALFESEGRAVVFNGLEDLSARIDDPALDVQHGDVLVLQNAGPHAAGMPEAGYLPIPKKLAQAGVKDMVRISDARMSGTAFGSIVLHVAPEAAIGGPLAAVRTGDRIRLSIENKRIDLLVDDAEIRHRLKGFQPPPAPARGYKALYRRTVTQAPKGCDFDFLAQPSSENLKRHAHQVRILSTLSIKAAADGAIVPAFEAATGCKAVIDWAPTTVLMPKLAAGALADVVILVDEAMDELARQNMIDPATRVHLVNSQVGVAVREGAAHPDISDLDAFKRTLLQARSVAYSRGGASGIYFGQMLTELGIADAVNAKATIIPGGFTAEKLLTGEADIAVQQVSELLAVNGIAIVGRFPPPVRKVVSVSAAVLRSAENRSRAEQFMVALTNPTAMKAYRDIGLDGPGDRLEE